MTAADQTLPPESIVSMTDYHDLQEKYNNLQQKMTELKDSKIYIKKLDLQLEKTLDDHKEISDKYDLSQGMLNEKTSIIKKLQEICVHPIKTFR